MNFNEETESYLKSFYNLKSSILPDIEYEFLFGSTRQSDDNVITYSQFSNLLKDMKSEPNNSNWQQLPQTTTLDIQVHRTNNIEDARDYFDIRFTINNSKDISIYCQTDDIDSVPYDVMYKKQHNFTSDNIEYINSYLTEGQKNKYKVDSRAVLDIPDYGLKCNLKHETSLDHKSKQFTGRDSNLVNSARTEYTEYRDYLKSKNNKFSKLYKTFRLKNRYSFVSTKGIRLDMTVVQQSRSDIDSNGRSIQVPVMNFLDSNLLNEEKRFEVELEILYDNGLPFPEYGDLSPFIKETLENIKVSLQAYPYIISHTEASHIQTIYTSLVKKNYIDITNKKIEVLEKLIQIAQLDTSMPENAEMKTELSQQCIALDEYYYKSMVGKEYQNALSDIKKTRDLLKGGQYPYIKNGPVFNISPKPVSLDIKDIQQGTKNSILDIPYSVTDKADGLAKVLYIVGTDHLAGEDNPCRVSDEDLETYKKYEGNVYLIDSNLVVYKTNLKVTGQYLSELSNTLLNGEYLNSDIHGREINLYKAYDLYFLKNNDIKYLPLISNDQAIDTRISILNDILDNIHNKLEYYDNREEHIPLTIESKKFLIGHGNDIFTQSKSVWNKYKNHESGYKYDGLIYTPCDLPVAYSVSPNYDINVSSTWEKNFKWKPPHENTIDFLVKEETETDETYRNTEYRKPKIMMTTKSEVDRTYVQYKTYTLKVGKNEQEVHNPCIKYGAVPKKKNTRYLPTDFIPTQPFSRDACNAKLIIDDRKKQVVGNEWTYNKQSEIVSNENSTVVIEGQWDNTNDIIKDDTIVEFSYMNYSENDHRYIKDPLFRWLPLRTRHDKTYKYRRGVEQQKSQFVILQKFIKRVRSNISAELSPSEKKLLDRIRRVVLSVPKISPKGSLYQTLTDNIDLIEEYYPGYKFITQGVSINYGNDFKTANHNWKLIHNPITEDMITTGMNIPSEIDQEEKYYNRDLSTGREKSLTIALQEFHNKIVKNKVLLTNITNAVRSSGEEPMLLDLATGKGGDISKWMDNRIKNIVGIDINHNNITDVNDGACKRLEDMVQNRKYKEDMREYIQQCNINFLVGDVSRNIESGQAFTEPYSKDMWYKIWKNPNEDISESAMNKFNMISIMFGIHYMCKNEEDLDNFITNVDQNLAEGGYFIGTCIDGEKLFNLFETENIEKNGYLTGYKNKKIIWKIQKKYGTGVFQPTSASLGLPIGVYISSINQEIVEYLVHFEYLKLKLEEKGIDLISPEEAINNGLPRNSDGGTGLFDQIYANMTRSINSKELSLSDEKLYKKITTGLTPDEKQISFLSRYFVFKKRDTSNIEVKTIYDIIKRNSSEHSEWAKIIRKDTIDSDGLKSLVVKATGKVIDHDIWQDVIKKVVDGLARQDIKPKTRGGDSVSAHNHLSNSKKQTIETESISEKNIKLLQMQRFYNRINEQSVLEMSNGETEQLITLIEKYLDKFSSFKDVSDVQQNVSQPPNKMWQDMYIMKDRLKSKFT